MCSVPHVVGVTPGVGAALESTYQPVKILRTCAYPYVFSTEGHLLPVHPNISKLSNLHTPHARRAFSLPVDCQTEWVATVRVSAHARTVVPTQEQGYPGPEYSQL